METTLAVDRRHLALPDSCLFAPTELQIGPSLSQNEFSRLGTALGSVDQASDLWACDYALAGQKRWGVEGLKLASTATRLSVGYLKISARIAERFDPARRYANMTREHYRVLCCFPVDFTDEWLLTVVEKGFGARTLRALAVEAFGSDPKAGYSKNKKRNIVLPETLYARLKACSPVPKTAVFIEQILLNFVSSSTPEQKARITAALSTREADKVRTRRKVKKPRVEKPEKIEEPADVKFQIQKLRKEQQSETPRSTYAERREQHLADGVASIPAKAQCNSCRGRYKSRIRIVFTKCDGLSYIEDTCGTMRPLTKATASRFNSLEKAEEAAREYSEDRGYACEAFLCERCSAERSIWHVRGKNFHGGTIDGTTTVPLGITAL
jgi:hypothetical protein